jgi:hypothetical protein
MMHLKFNSNYLSPMALQRVAITLILMLKVQFTWTIIHIEDTPTWRLAYEVPNQEYSLSLIFFYWVNILFTIFRGKLSIK